MDGIPTCSQHLFTWFVRSSDDGHVRTETFSLTHNKAWCVWRKLFYYSNKGCLALARQCPGSQGICNPEETGLPGLPVYWWPTLFSGSGTVGLPPVPWTEKKQLKFRHFSSDADGHCCRADLVGRTMFWTSFWVAWKRYSKGLRSLFSFVGSMLNKSRVWSLLLVSFLFGLKIISTLSQWPWLKILA